MGRRDRIEYTGLTYHVFSRGNRRAKVFRRPEDYSAYLDDLERLTREMGAKVLAFCLMPNHPHLTLRIEGAPLSLLMQRLTLRHAKRFNRTYRVRGHLNECRYKAKVVASDAYLLSLIKYIHLNPVKARMVRNAAEWPYSSHGAYLGLGFPWVETAPVLAALGGPDRYEPWMNEALTGEQTTELERSLFRPGRVRLTDELIHWRPRRPGPWSVRRPELPATALAQTVADRLGIDLGKVAGADRSLKLRAQRRLIATTLRGRGYRLREIAEVMGRSIPEMTRMLQRARRVPSRVSVHSDAQVELFAFQPMTVGEGCESNSRQAINPANESAGRD